MTHCHHVHHHDQHHAPLKRSGALLDAHPFGTLRMKAKHIQKHALETSRSTNPCNLHMTIFEESDGYTY